MTVQTLINAAVLYIADTDNIADYDTTYLPMVTQVIGELMQLKIGVQNKTYTVTVPTSPDFTSSKGTPVKMPTDLTDENQIVDIIIEYYDRHYSFTTETNSGSFYVFVPDDYGGEITVKYAPVFPTFTTLTDTLPISDSAAQTVAAYGLAALLSTDSTQALTNYYEQKYAEAKARWIRKNLSAPKQVKHVYSYD